MLSSKFLEILEQLHDKQTGFAVPAAIWLLSGTAQSALDYEYALKMFSLILHSEDEHDWLPVLAFPLIDRLSPPRSSNVAQTNARIRAMLVQKVEGDKLRRQIEAIFAMRYLSALELNRRDVALRICFKRQTKVLTREHAKRWLIPNIVFIHQLDEILAYFTSLQANSWFGDEEAANNVKIISNSANFFRKFNATLLANSESRAIETQHSELCKLARAKP